MKTILVIEDDELLREGIVFVLNLEGFEVLESANGRDGLAIAQAELPDLITCDLNLPGLNGEGIAEALASDPKTANIPIMFITGSEPIALSSSVQCDYMFLQKPFEPEQLAIIIWNLIG